MPNLSMLENTSSVGDAVLWFPFLPPGALLSNRLLEPAR